MDTPWVNLVAMRVMVASPLGRQGLPTFAAVPLIVAQNTRALLVLDARGTNNVAGGMAFRYILRYNRHVNAPDQDNFRCV